MDIIRELHSGSVAFFAAASVARDITFNVMVRFAVPILVPSYCETARLEIITVFLPSLGIVVHLNDGVSG